MRIRKLLATAAISVTVGVTAFALLALASQVYTTRTLASWEEERARRTGPLSPLPEEGEDKFDSSTTLGFVPGCSDPLLMSTVIATGPTTIQRGDPITLPDGREQIDTEIVQLDLQGTFMAGPLTGPVTIRVNPDRQSLGQITQIEAGEDFPAESFFGVWFEVEIDFLGATTTLVNREPVPMRRIIYAIPPLLVDYRPPPDLLVQLYDRDSGAYWGCMVHPAHSTIPPVIKTASVPDPTNWETVQFEIAVMNPDSDHSVPIYLIESLDLLPNGFLILQAPPELLEGPGHVYVYYEHEYEHEIIWEADNNYSNGMQPVELGPLQTAVISFTAQVWAIHPGAIIPNIVQVDSAPLGLTLTQPLTLIYLVSGGQGNVTEANLEVEPFVQAGHTYSASLSLPNTGVHGTAVVSGTGNIPQGTTYVPGSVTGGATYDFAMNAVSFKGLEILPGDTITIEHRVLLSDTASAGQVLTYTATYTDNWGNSFTLEEQTVVVDNAIPAMMNHELGHRPTDGVEIEAGGVYTWNVRVVDRQGVNVADGTEVGLSSSGGGLAAQGRESRWLSAQDVITLTTVNGLISPTITSAISQTIVITAETTNGLVETLTFYFWEGYSLLLPMVLKS